MPEDYFVYSTSTHVAFYPESAHYGTRYGKPRVTAKLPRKLKKHLRRLCRTPYDWRAYAAPSLPVALTPYAEA